LDRKREAFNKKISEFVACHLVKGKKLWYDKYGEKFKKGKSSRQGGFL
jgi:hypothetical protein